MSSTTSNSSVCSSETSKSYNPKRETNVKFIYLKTLACKKLIPKKERKRTTVTQDIAWLHTLRTPCLV